jgi:hypothetical protein
LFFSQQKEYSPMTTNDRTRVLWISKHAPLPIQTERLCQVYGNEVLCDHKDIGNAQEIAQVFREGRYTDLVCVVPGSILDRICRTDLRPLHAEMTTVFQQGRRPDLVFGGKNWWFEKFVRVNAFELQLSPLTPRHGVRTILRISGHHQSSGELQVLQNNFGLSLEFIDDKKPLPREIKEAVLEVLKRKCDVEAQEVVLAAPYSVYQALGHADVIRCLGGHKPLYVKFENGIFQGVFRVEGVLEEVEEFIPR